MPEEPIPKFIKCVKDKNGDLWCFEKRKKAVCRVIPVDPATVPQDVLYELLIASNENKD